MQTNDMSVMICPFFDLDQGLQTFATAGRITFIYMKYGRQ